MFDEVVLAYLLKKIKESGGGGGSVTSVNGKTGAVTLKASDIKYDSGKTIEEEFEAVDKAVAKAGQYKTQAGTYASEAAASKNAILEKFVECESMEEYKEKLEAGLIKRDSLAVIREPELEVI